MHELKKYAAIAGGVAMVACWPLVVGQIGEKLVNDNLHRLNNSNLNVELVDYDRGYLSSDVTTKVMVVDPSLKLQLESDHLPTEWVLSSNVSHNVLGLETTTTLSEYPDIPLMVQSKTQLNGDTHFDATLGAVNYDFSTAATNTNLQIAPTTLSGDVTLERMIEASFTMPKLTLTNTNGDSFIVDNISSTAKGQLRDRIWTGSQKLSIGNIEFLSAADDAVYVAENMNYEMNGDYHQFESKDNQDNKPAEYSNTTLISFERIIAEEQQLDDIKFSSHIDGIDADALNNLLNTVQSGSSQVDQKQIMATIDKLIEHGLTFSIPAFEFSYLNQPVSSSLSLNVASGKKNISQDPLAMMGLINGSSGAQVPKALAKQIPILQKTIDQLLAKEYITETEADYVFNAKIEDGKILFSNGQKLPIIAALMPFFMR